MEEVPKELFLSRVCECPIQDLFTSHGFRRFLYQKFLSLPELHPPASDLHIPELTEPETVSQESD
jgi:hypothetical protein